MDQGVSTLLGALAGGAATFGGVVFGQWRLEARNRAEAKERAEAAALISARIVQGELAWAEARARQALENGKYWSARYGLKEDAWLAYREQLAVALDSSDDWSTVRDGFRSLHTLELQASKRRANDLTRAEVNDWGRKELKFGLTRIVEAIEVLRPIAQDRPREAMGTDPARTEAEPTIEAG
jgi:hypothetical protein